MSPPPGQIPQFPAVLATAFRAAPLAPLSLSLTMFSRGIARRHPALFRRLGEYSHTRFVLDPTDLPFVIVLDPNGGAPRVTLMRGQGDGAARIAGPLAALLGLVHGAFDGDALFFSRDLVVEGDTSAALALRNAIDDSELDLSEEITRYCGPMKGPLQKFFTRIEHYSGVSLTRAEEGLAW
ncbi:ubiquinone anaerobic biosynthesis accessory factor UbiT [Roseovarius dicentrarchi]|uniref:ubiquinone anaerobic biosynthesis accessory factor UbiT n=1 Tax=Roseovarius dicentrarchi TaxID=2250573 RepID=UPI001EEFDC2A|nr:SCP2 sterol-binding domain-containing protein [Roseovarius dicentrarchi]